MQDGDVPVTVVRGRNETVSDTLRATPASPVNRIEALQESLTAEQAARAAGERALEEAQATIRTLQTRLSHLELSRDEAVAQAQAQAEAAAAALAEAALQAEQRLAPEAPAAKSVAMAARVTRAKRQKQNDQPPEQEPEPVKWWLSSQAMRPTPAKRGRPRTETPE